MNSDDPTSATRMGTGGPGHVHASGAAAARAVAARIPESVAGYRILRLLAEGGMGAVYEAEQSHPHRVVALKVIRPGYATPELIRRFQMESQALGRLQHPGIAQIYEAGTAETAIGAQPYFAMELIRGPGLLEYAKSRSLATRERMELVARLCDAVQHAHQRGLVHRDLKPANVLVDANGQPKILDFGIASATDSDAQATRQTDLGELVGTLAYMSPEQVLGDPFEIDVRTDVYALGLILYELLAGRLPYEVSRRALPEAVRIIREQDAEPLSSISRVYRGDIETIVRKALEKEKSQRYASAADLAADIRRYLHDEPIAARPPSTLYQLQKFSRRHRALVGGIVAVMLVLVAGFIATSVESVRARRAEQTARQAESMARSERDHAIQAESNTRHERDRAVTAETSAESERDRAVKAEAQARRERDMAIAETRRADREAATATSINDFLQSDLLAQASAIGQGPGAKADPEIKVRTVLDRAAGRIEGRFAGKPGVEGSIESTIGHTYSRLGLYPQALQHLARAYDLERGALGNDNEETLATGEVLGEAYRSAGKLSEAEILLRAIVDGYTRTKRTDTSQAMLAVSALAGTYVTRGKPALAEPMLVDLIARERRLLGNDNQTTLESMGVLARVYFVGAKYADAERLLLDIIEGQSRTLGPEHATTTGTMNNLAVLYQKEGKYSESEALYGKVIGIYDRVLGSEHAETINVQQNLGVLYAEQGKYTEADAIYQHVLEVEKRTLGAEHPRTLTVIANLAMLRRGQGRYQDAEALGRDVVATRARVLGPDHPDTIESALNLAGAYEAEGKFDEAEPLILKAVESRKRALGAKHANTVSAAVTLGELRLQQQKYAEAESILREAVEAAKENMPKNFTRFAAESWLGATLAARQKFAEAEPLLLSGYEGMERRAATVSALRREELKKAGEHVLEFYRATHETAKALQWSERLARLR